MRQNHDATTEQAPAQPGVPDRNGSPSGRPQLAIDELGHLVAALDQTAIVAVTDVKGRILDANDKFCEISGYSRDELLGQDHRILKSGAHSDELFRDMYRVIANGEVWRGEFCNRAKSGRLYWVDTTIIPRLDARGKVVGYTSIRVDITQRKTMEEALRRSEQLLRSTMIGTRRRAADPGSRRPHRRRNPAATRILGLSDDPQAARRCSTRLDRDQGRRPRLSGGRASGGDHARHRRAAARRGDGFAQAGRRDHLDLDQFRGDPGRRRLPGSVVTSCSDITARRQAEEIFKEAIAALPDGFVIFDRDDRLIACNDAYRQIYAASAPAIRRGVVVPGSAALRLGPWPIPRGRRHRAATGEMARRPRRPPPQSVVRSGAADRRTDAGCRSASGARRAAISSASAPTSARSCAKPPSCRR